VSLAIGHRLGAGSLRRGLLAGRDGPSGGLRGPEGRSTEDITEGGEAWLERGAANYEVPILPLGELREHTLMYGDEYMQNG